MQTRFLLHGGRVKLPDDRNDRFFRELVKDLKDGDEVLSVGFANRDKTQRQEYFERDKGFLLAQAKSNVKVINASHESLVGQIKSAKSIYITGGKSSELIPDIYEYQDFIKLLRGKLVGGTSAGACLFATYFLNSHREVKRGLGLFPIRLVVHYGNPEFNATDETLELLDAYPKELELVVLKECEWVERIANI